MLRIVVVLPAIRSMLLTAVRFSPRVVYTRVVGVCSLSRVVYTRVGRVYTSLYARVYHGGCIPPCICPSYYTLGTPYIRTLPVTVLHSCGADVGVQQRGPGLNLENNRGYEAQRALRSSRV